MEDLGTVEERVARGIAALAAYGETPPNWYFLINLETLNIFHPFSCVLGQIFEEDEYSSGYTKHVFEIVGDGWSSEFGFNSPDRQEQTALEGTWRAEILRLRSEHAERELGQAA